MGLTLVTPPTEWPVTLAEAKAQCRVTDTSEDGLIETYIKAATRYVEQTLGTSIAEQTWKLTLDEFSDAIELLRGPVISVDTFQYYDADGLTQTVDAGLYSTDLTSRSQWLVLNSDESWPTVLDAVNAVSVTYTAGMETVPDDLRAAILLLVGTWYGQRETISDKPVSQVPFAVDALLQTYRMIFV